MTKHLTLLIALLLLGLTLVACNGDDEAASVTERPAPAATPAEDAPATEAAGDATDEMEGEEAPADEVAEGYGGDGFDAEGYGGDGFDAEGAGSEDTGGVGAGGAGAGGAAGIGAQGAGVTSAELEALQRAIAEMEPAGGTDGASGQ